MERLVEVVGDAGKIAEVLKQREQREKNRHRRQHYRHNPRQNAVCPVNDNSAQPFGCVKPHKQLREPVTEPKQPCAEPFRRIIRPDNRYPENNQQRQNHNRKPKRPACEQLVDFRDFFRGLRNRSLSRFRSVFQDTGRDFVREHIRGYPRSRENCPRAFNRQIQLIRKKVLSKAVFQLVSERIIAVNQHKRKPPRRYFRGVTFVNFTLNFRNRLFNRHGIAESARIWRYLARTNSVELFRKRGKRFFLVSRRSRNRHAKPLFKQFKVDFYTRALSLVEKVYAYDCFREYLHNLKRKVQTAFKAGRVAYYNNRVRASETDEIPRNFFLGGMREKGIRPRNVNQNIPEILRSAKALCGRNRLSGPVSRMLMKSRKRVKQGAFPNVRVTRNRYYFIVRGMFFHDKTAVFSANSR